MIEDKKLGLKIAEDSNEAFWTKTLEDTNARIEEMQCTYMIETAIVRLCEEKLKKYKKQKDLNSKDTK